MKASKILENLTMYYRVAHRFVFRNQMILDNCWRKTEKGKVNLHWWMIPPTKNSPPQINVGDYLSYVIVEWMKEQNGIHTDDSFDGKTHHLYALGSIIVTGFHDATIWGSGALRLNQFWWRKIRKLDIRSVRGPVTQAGMSENGYDCPQIYGDPAILMPLIYTPADRTPKEDYVFIPNHAVESGAVHELSTITSDYKAFIDRIAQAKLVISSSLHGIILAEAYGVPAILLRNDALSLLKYQDYYQSTGRDTFPVATSVEEALTMTPPATPELAQMQKNVMAAFPKDLWLGPEQ